MRRIKLDESLNEQTVPIDGLSTFCVDLIRPKGYDVIGVGRSPS